MNTGREEFQTGGAARDGTDPIAELLRRVEPRPPLPDGPKERVRDAVRTQWRRTLRTRRRRHVYVLSGSLAAALVLTVLLTPVARERFSTFMAPSYQGPVGTVSLVRGLAWYSPEGTPEQFPGRRVVADDALEAGARIHTTPEARVALTLLDGRSVRVDRDSRIRMLTPTTLELLAGTVYVDSGLDSDVEGSVEIRTPLGRVYDVGTQFEVRFSDEALRIRVREGSVSLDRVGELLEAVAGTELSVDSAGFVSRRDVDVRGPIWDWVLEVAPPYPLEGSSLASFLAWVARETGREIRFSDEGLASSAATTILHGSVDDLRPDEALIAVLPTCGLTHRGRNGSWILDSLAE